MFARIWAWYPPVGVFIALLALISVVVPLFRDSARITKAEKAVWTALFFVLVGLEFRSIYLDRNAHDREQAEARSEQLAQFRGIAGRIDTSIQQGQQEFQATVSQSQSQFAATLNVEKHNLTQTMSGIEETMAAATGGNGFCYAILVPPDYAGNASVISTVIPQGKYPLTNVTALITDDDMIVQHLNETSTEKMHSADDFANTMQRAQEWIHIGDLPPQFPEQISIRAATVTGDRRMLTIMFWANNGSWTEKFALRRVNGKWLRLIRVWRQRLDKKKKAMVSDVILNQVDDGYPEDANTKDPSGVSASR